MIEPLLIRPARGSDVDSIVAFNAAMAMETEHRRLDLLRLRQGVLALLEKPERGFYIVAEAPGMKSPQLIGQLMITFEWSDWRNGVFWWIQSVYVEPTQRRRGVFRSMYHHIMAKAHADGQVCGVRLYVEQDNDQAQTVYQRMGLAPSAYAVFERDFVLPSRTSPHII